MEDKFTILDIKNTLSMTSESIFDISSQPEEQCPNIDHLIDTIGSASNWILSSINDVKKCDIDECALYSAEQVISGVYDLELKGELEDLRSKICEIREWGQEWKDLACNLLESNTNIQDYCSHDTWERFLNIKNRSNGGE